MMRKKLPLLFNLLFLLPLLVALSAQAKAKGNNLRTKIEPIRCRSFQDISGIVTNEAGQPLEGVSVAIKGTKKGTITNAKGEFSIKVAGGEELIFSSVDYKTITINPGNKTMLNIQMEQEIKSGSEVIVVGYGTQKKSQLIGSVSQVSAEKINNRTVPNLTSVLTGQMPGVTIIQRSGRPNNNNTNIQIRGVGSFGSSSDAFILVDGIPVSSFNQIDPNDIASVSVLKDASSAAIYGARSANGVILVTTKSGAMKDKVKVGYNGYYGIQKVTALPQTVNSWEFATAVNEAEPGSYTEEQIQKFKDGNDPDKYPNPNYHAQFFKPHAKQTGHNINISGGSLKNQYMLSFGTISQDGIVIKNNYNRYNFRFNITTKLAEKLSITTRLNTNFFNVKEPAPNASHDFTTLTVLIGQVVRYQPIYPIKLSNGDWGGGGTGKGQPISMLHSMSFYKANGLNFDGNTRVDFTPINGLKLSAIFGAYASYGAESRFLATQQIGSTLTGPSSLNQNNSFSNYRTVQGLADYNKKIQQHDFSLLVGYSFEQAAATALLAGRSDFPDNVHTSLNLGAATGQTNDGNATQYALESYFGRLKYGLLNKYLLEGTLRYDGSSRFPVGNKYALFYAGAIGWRISEENFIKDNINWLSDLKIKASIGLLGNQDNDTYGNYPYLQLLNTGSGFNYSFGNRVNTGIIQTTVYDPTLKWESTETRDIGLEFGILKGMLSGSATYFIKNTSDILVSPGGSVSRIFGFNLGLVNSGKLRNSGFEFTLDYRDKINAVTININTNLSIINNKVIDVGVGNVLQPNGLVGNASTPLFIGHPMQTYYGYIADGLFTDTTEAKNWANQSAVGSKKLLGDIRYVDVSGPNGKPDGIIDANYDRVILGSRIPKYTFGLTLGIQFKGFDFSTLLQGVTGVKGFLNGQAGWAFYNTATIQRWMYEGRFDSKNPQRYAAYPRLEIISNAGSGNTVPSSFWIIDGSYFRIKNIQIGYNLPEKILTRLKLQNCRISIAGENIKTFSQYRQGWDPEINTGGEYYPILRNFTLGLNLTF